jgi:hypothetical protein
MLLAIKEWRVATNVGQWKLNKKNGLFPHTWADKMDRSFDSHTRVKAVLQQLYNTVAERENEIEWLRKDMAQLRILVKAFHPDDDGC